MSRLPAVFILSRVLALEAPHIHRGLGLFPEAMQQEVLRFRRKEDQCRSLGGKLLLRHGLRQLGYSYDFSTWRRTPESHRPLFPQGPAFSISHAGDFVICGLSQGPIGVDVEHMNRPALSCTEKIFTVPEKTAMEKSAHPHRLFFMIWTRKEAVLKAMGTGFLHPPHTIDVLSSPVSTPLTAFHLHPISLPEGYMAWCALEGKKPPFCENLRPCDLLGIA